MYTIVGGTNLPPLVLGRVHLQKLGLHGYHPRYHPVYASETSRVEVQEPGLHALDLLRQIEILGLQLQAMRWGLGYEHHPVGPQKKIRSPVHICKTHVSDIRNDGLHNVRTTTKQ